MGLCFIRGFHDGYDEEDGSKIPYAAGRKAERR